VRVHLGGRALQTQPYRLLTPSTRTRLRSHGSYQTAGRHGAGRLPRSTAAAPDGPAVVEARGLLDESMRRSLLTPADSDLLSRWLVPPCGADDLAAAGTLVAVLPVGVPAALRRAHPRRGRGRRMSLAAPEPGSRVTRRDPRHPRGGLAPTPIRQQPRAETSARSRMHKAFRTVRLGTVCAAFGDTGLRAVTFASGCWRRKVRR